MKLGDHVRKVSGYPWPGVIVADFTTSKGHRRLVVECTVPEVAGALHIYSPDQLEVDYTMTTYVDLSSTAVYAAGTDGPPVVSRTPPRTGSGDVCPSCGNFHMVRSGTCMTCMDCGSTTGCS